MSWKGDLERVDDYRWRVPRGAVPCMRTDAVIFASESMLPSISEDNSLLQAANVACLPGIVGSSVAMPDVHWGYGFPIGGVAAVDAVTGHISPGGIGFDINCGVRLIRTDLREEDLKGRLDPLMDALYANIPSGLGSKGLKRLSRDQIDDVLENGSRWAVENGFGWDDDLDVTENGGRMESADPSKVSDKAKERGIPQLGSLGSGNHFLEVDVVDEVFGEEAAEAFGLEKGTVTVTVHCGSRGCGHQIATDYIREMERYIKKHDISLPDPQLACAPLDSEEGADYFAAMSCGANYAWANRQMITHWIRESFEKVFRSSAGDLGMSMVYDVAHNIAKKERHNVDGREMDVLVHRKGATRAFPAGHPDVPERYRAVGQPVIVPGDMSVGTYVLVGLQGSMDLSFGSSCHGAGRRMSRKAALRSIRASEVKADLKKDGIMLRSGSDGGLVEEAPETYKDVEEVVSVVSGSGLAGRVARLRPLGVIKG
ncbi:MAG: RtcB family protein [Thermoplasmatales archaeon]|jgi:tRNA-splicing ligase RtcB|nr:RtcB family protein [Thermoplasmatales archaeon]